MFQTLFVFVSRGRGNAYRIVRVRQRGVPLRVPRCCNIYGSSLFLSLSTGGGGGVGGQGSPVSLEFPVACFQLPDIRVCLPSAGGITRFTVSTGRSMDWELVSALLGLGPSSGLGLYLYPYRVSHPKATAMAVEK